eukprot:CAMPEP_0204372200 /NCGR_PEP_ID=MMETSP0469-20131031/47097_1 /ASSEMBLY_ACC=CAM_ASM_000384 /TAXON_ID=2969 /ORGANISM="Oxyrrhis marina" /LENGTH=107 /DNA_ID=CAMNT_0051362459 /DNA_START=126 /DNA_END=450 /DNA_ORIENTATION=-
MATAVTSTLAMLSRNTRLPSLCKRCLNSLFNDCDNRLPPADSSSGASSWTRDITDILTRPGDLPAPACRPAPKTDRLAVPPGTGPFSASPPALTTEALAPPSCRALE